MEAVENTAPEANQFFTVSRYKLSIMFIMTLGLYAVYWFYKNWKLQQPLMDKKIWPVMRGIFSIFFTHALFERIRRIAEEKGIQEKYSYSAMATRFVVLVVVGNVIGNFDGSDVVGIFTVISLVLMLVSLYPLVVIQDTVNHINNDPHGLDNDDITLANYALMVLGALLWFFIVVGLLVEFGYIAVAWAAGVQPVC
jgi:hypothetical protein